jgi:hypothetical protein
MKRSRTHSSKSNQNKKTQIILPETLFSWLPIEIMNIITQQLEAPWKRNLDVALKGSSNISVRDEVDNIAKYGTKICKYFVESNLISTRFLSRYACFYGDKELYDYAHLVNKLNINEKEHYEYAAAGGKTIVLNYLFKHGFLFDARRLYRQALYGNDLKTIETLTNNIKPTEIDVMSACYYGNLDGYLHLTNILRYNRIHYHLYRALSSFIPLAPSNVVLHTVEFRKEIKMKFIRYMLSVGIVPEDHAYYVTSDFDSMMFLMDMKVYPNEERISSLVYITYPEKLWARIIDEHPNLSPNYMKIILSVCLRDHHFDLADRMRSQGVNWPVLEYYSYNPEMILYCTQKGFPDVTSISRGLEYVMLKKNCSGQIFEEVLQSYPTLRLRNSLLIEFIMNSHNIKDFNNKLKSLMKYTHWNGDLLIVPIINNDPTSVITLFEAGLRPKRSAVLMLLETIRATNLIPNIFSGQYPMTNFKNFDHENSELKSLLRRCYDISIIPLSNFFIASTHEFPGSVSRAVINLNILKAGLIGNIYYNIKNK